MNKKKLSLIFAIALLQTGCATFRSYDSETSTLVSSIGSGQVDEAISKLEKNASGEKDILYYMEKGELQRLKKLYPDTIATWTEADKIIAEWENEAKVSTKKIGEGIGSVIINDKIQRYDGEDYEKVMLSTRLALAYLAAGKTEDALVEIKKTWEREDFIKSLHEKEFDEAENEAKGKGYTTKSEDLKGYPIATLNSPEVTNLKNGYQNAFSHYLSGFLYEAQGDLSLATASYRTAIELQPTLQFLKDSLAGIDSRQGPIPNAGIALVSNEPESASKKKNNKKSKKGKNSTKKENSHVAFNPVNNNATITAINLNANESDVLLVVENGVAPTKKSIMIPLPIPQAGVVPISFPVIETDPISANKAISVLLPNNTTVALSTIASIENLSRRSLKDHLPWIMVRSAIRAAVKGGAQAAAYKQNALAGLAVNALNVATEQADERTWKLLPSEITIARIKLPEGTSTIKLQTPQGIKEVTVNISGKHVVVPIRLIGNSIYNLQSSL
jgi:hypothetical protein